MPRGEHALCAPLLPSVTIRTRGIAAAGQTPRAHLGIRRFLASGSCRRAD
jgi:hypothetical protein